MNRRERLEGVLLGTAVGDALGLPCEGLSPAAVARRFEPLDRFRLVGGTGFVSDDTEQSALVAQALARHPTDVHACARDFRKTVFGWFLRLPFGIGLATIRACVRIGLGFKRSGVGSAGNGAAMRAAIVGAYFADEPERRRSFGRQLAEVTHVDPRGVEGALFVAEVASGCSNSTERVKIIREALAIVKEATLREAIELAILEEGTGTTRDDAVKRLGTTGFVLHTAAFATFVFLRDGGDGMRAIRETIRAGGDTDSIGAIVGAWMGALHGPGALEPALVNAIHDGPFGPTHLRGLAAALDEKRAPPAYSATGALLRNLMLYPVVLAHGFRRLLP